MPLLPSNSSASAILFKTKQNTVTPHCEAVKNAHLYLLTIRSAAVAAFLTLPISVISPLPLPHAPCKNAKTTDEKLQKLNSPEP